MFYGLTPFSRTVTISLLVYTLGMLGLGLCYGANPYTFAVNGFILGIGLSALVVDRQIMAVRIRLMAMAEEAVRTQLDAPAPLTPEAYLRWVQQVLENQDRDEDTPTRH